MTRFEEIGAQLQGDCTSIDQAVKTMNYSCSLCATKGVKVQCSKCAIAVAHEQVCTILLDVEEAKYNAAMKRLHEDRRVCGQEVRRRKPVPREYVSGKHRTHVCHYD